MRGRDYEVEICGNKQWGEREVREEVGRRGQDRKSAMMKELIKGVKKRGDTRRRFLKEEGEKRDGCLASWLVDRKPCRLRLNGCLSQTAMVAPCSTPLNELVMAPAIMEWRLCSERAEMSLETSRGRKERERETERWETQGKGRETES